MIPSLPHWDTTYLSIIANKSKSTPIAGGGGGKYQLKEEDDLNARLTSLSRRLDAMLLRKVIEIRSLTKEDIYGICETMGHPTHECPTIPAFRQGLHDQANSVNSYQNPTPSTFSETSNSGWRNHPNFSWRNDNTAQLPPPQGLSNHASYVSPPWKTLDTLQ